MSACMCACECVCCEGCSAVREGSPSGQRLTPLAGEYNFPRITNRIDKLLIPRAPFPGLNSYVLFDGVCVCVHKQSHACTRFDACSSRGAGYEASVALSSRQRSTATHQSGVCAWLCCVCAATVNVNAFTLIEEALTIMG